MQLTDDATHELTDKFFRTGRKSPSRLAEPSRSRMGVIDSRRHRYGARAGHLGGQATGRRGQLVYFGIPHKAAVASRRPVGGNRSEDRRPLLPATPVDLSARGRFTHLLARRSCMIISLAMRIFGIPKDRFVCRSPAGPLASIGPPIITNRGNDMSPIVANQKITHVFVLMLENHSFDNIFAMSGIPGLKTPSPGAKNTYKSVDYPVQDNAPTSMATDPGHEFLDVLEQLAGVGATYPNGGPYPLIDSSGFAANYATSLTEQTGLPQPGQIGDVMKCFDTPSQLPVIHQLATEFAVCDQWFSSLPGPTWPNRFFVHEASSAGLDHSPSGSEIFEWESNPFGGFEYPNGSIYDALTKAGLNWRLYIDHSGPVAGSFAQVQSIKGIHYSSLRSFTNFAADLQGPYPYQYTFIEPNYGNLVDSSYQHGSSQHPMDGMNSGEGLIKAVYEAIRNSPLWF